MKIGRNDPCWCGSGKKYKKCHMGQLPDSVPKPRFQILEGSDLVSMRAACKLAATILNKTCARVVAGVNTQQINDWVLDMTLEAGAYPAPLNYPKGQTNPRNPTISPGGFPASVCTSINHVICHGIPNKDEILKDGDIVNIDVTCCLDGFYGDTSRTLMIGTPSAEARKVTEAAETCLKLGIDVVRPGGRLIDVAHAITNHAEGLGLSVVRDYTGHGIGRVFHTEPQVCHYPNKNSDCELETGMIFTIEPMINEGSFRTKLDRKDNWTVYTVDNSLSAQFEHTIRVTETGAEILTLA